MEITREETEKLKSEMLHSGTDWEGLDSNCCGASIIWCDICNDCKEYHHIGKEFFKIVDVSDNDLDMIINRTVEKFKEKHHNHDIEIKEMSPLPFNYNLFIIPFNWDIEEDEEPNLFTKYHDLDPFD